MSVTISPMPPVATRAPAVPDVPIYRLTVEQYAALVRGARRDYRERRPTAAEIAMVVEIADTSLEQDRGLKKRLFARAGIVVYWIVNRVDRQIEVYTDPTGPVDEPDFRQRRDSAAADSIPVRLDGMEVGSLAVRELLP